MKQVAVVYNPQAGSGASKADITEAFNDLAVNLHFIDIADNIEQCVKQITNPAIDILVAAGGDGTVNAVAQAAVALNITIGVLPVGTLNHFAKDAGLPLDIGLAAQAIVKGSTTHVDFCTVNDRLFVNNSSVGIYPLTVRRRQRWSSTIGKWPAAIVAGVTTLYKLRTPRLRLQYNNTDRVFKTPLVFVGNNRYRLESVGLSSRQTLRGGQLFLYVVRANRPTAILGMAVLLLFGKRRAGHDISEIASEITISTTHKSIHVAIDGELAWLDSPLRYRLHAKQLSLRVP